MSPEPDKAGTADKSLADTAAGRSRDHLRSTLAGASSPEIPDALQALHPVLLAALHDPIASGALADVLGRQYQGVDHSRPLSELIVFLNTEVTRIMNALEDPTVHLNESTGRETRKQLTSYCVEVGEASMGVRLIFLALDTFAKTILRQAIKRNNPYSEEVFKGEKVLISIMQDFLAGPFSGGNRDAPI